MHPEVSGELLPLNQWRVNWSAMNENEMHLHDEQKKELKALLDRISEHSLRFLQSGLYRSNMDIGVQSKDIAEDMHELWNFLQDYSPEDKERGEENFIRAVDAVNMAARRWHKSHSENNSQMPDSMGWFTPQRTSTIYPDKWSI